MKAIVNGKLILPDRVIENHVIIFTDQIIDIVTEDEFNNQNVEIINAEGNYVAPGLIDLHIHGSKGFDVMDGSEEALAEISAAIVKNGVTSFLPTTMTMDLNSIYQALKVIRKAKKKELIGAQVLGAHLEGPFINSQYKGAQNEEYIIKPDYSVIEDYLDIIEIITYAPEEDDNFSFLNRILQNEDNPVISLGHTNASYKEASRAINKGVEHCTHLFNAMTGLHHRSLGVVGAVMNSDVSAEIIADNIHLDKAIYNILQLKRDDKLVLITDAMRAACLKPGNYDLGGQEVIVNDNSARLVDGTLAGSILKLNQAVKNIYQNSDFSLNQAVNFASLNPAQVINIASERGSLKVGNYADIIIFDNNFEIITTIVEGGIKYGSD